MRSTHDRNDKNLFVFFRKWLNLHHMHFLLQLAPQMNLGQDARKAGWACLFVASSGLSKPPGIQATWAIMKGFVKYLIFGRRHSSQEHGAELDDDRHEVEDGSL